MTKQPKSQKLKWLITGRLKKSKTSKLFYYWKIANFIFEADPEEKDNYALEPDKYAKSVENHIRGLKQKYRDFNKELGQTGAGLQINEINDNPDLQNLVGKRLFFLNGLRSLIT